MDFTSKDKVLRLLEQAAASLDGSTGEDLGPAFKRYRQAVFKLNYKINKLNAAKRGAAKVDASVLKTCCCSDRSFACLSDPAVTGCLCMVGSAACILPLPGCVQPDLATACMP
jgi:hypothetical protein